MFRLQRLEITGFKSFVDHTELIFTGDGTTAIVGPNGCGKCVSGDTLVTLADGRELTIRELVENSLSHSSSIEVLDDGLITRQNPQAIRILSLHPETLRLEPRPVSAFVKREATPYLLRIRTRAGREVTATPYHPLFTLDQGRLRSLKAEELQAGVRIAVPRRLPVGGAAVPIRPHEVLAELREEDHIYIANSAAMRSWASDNRAIFGTWQNWMCAADVPASRFRGLPGGQAVGAAMLARLARVATVQPPLDSRFQSERAGGVRLPPTFTPDLARFLGLLVAEGRNTISNQTWFVNSDPAVNNEYARLAETQLGLEVHRYKYKAGVEDSLIYSRALGVMLERLFNYPMGSRSAEKEVPAQVLCSNEETQWAFLSGLFEGDAHVCARPQSGQRRPLAYIEYVSASQKLARQVISLLLRLGVFAVLRRKERYASNTLERRRRPYYSVLIYGIEQLQYTAARLSFVGEKQRALEAIKAIRPASNPNHDLVPGVTPLVKEAARTAGVKIKRHRRQHPKLAAYVENRCEASRGGLLEVAAQIEKLGGETGAARHTLDRLTVLATSDLYWDEIVSIEQVPPADPWVYDLSVAETHNFVAGNIVVHNSNISDAISWVLGEQKAKQLRGSEMKDVIFQGARNRPPAGMAEVVLHLVRDETMPIDADVEDIDSTLEDIDEHVVSLAGEQEKTSLAAADGPAPLTEANAAAPAKDAAEMEAAARKRGRRHWRPSRVALEFPPGETVTVARRLYRSGESEYLLNGRECRLRDIQDLFSGTGLSGAHYAIIEQGRIGQILSAKPMERRALIEEAAGITKFRVRQRAAEARLESARANLRRLTDITLEIERQVGSLRRQAAKARRYRAVREELRDLLRDVFVAEEQALSYLLAETRERLAEAETAELALGEILAARQDEAREATAAARLCEERLSEARARAAEFALQRDRRERECAYLREQVANLERRTGELDAELKALRLRAEEVAAECEALREQEAALRAASEETTQTLADYEEAYNQRLQEVAAAESSIESARAELLTHTAVAERLMEHGRQLAATLTRLTLQAESLAREGERASDAHKAAQLELTEIDAGIKTAEERRSALIAERDEATTVVLGARASAATANHELALLRDEHARVHHRLDTLAELDARRAQYSQAVRRLLAAGDDGATRDFHCVGTLADLLRVEPQWERAVEGTLGGLLQAVVVPTPDDALRAAQWLRANQAGRAHFIVAGLHGGGPQEGGVATEEATAERETGASADENASGQGPRVGDLLGAPRELNDSLLRALPRELAARVCNDLDQAIALSLSIGAMSVALDGEWCAGGLINAGDRRASDEGDSLLAFKRELRELTAQADELKAALPDLEGRAQAARAAVDEAESAVLSLNDAVGRAERELVGKELQAKQLAQDVERAARHVRVVGDDAARLAAEIADLEDRRAKAAADAERAELNRQTSLAAVAQATTLLALARRESEGENERLGGQRAIAAAAAERRRAAMTELRRREAEREDLRSRIERHTQEAAAIDARLTEIMRSIDRLEEDAGDTAEESSRIERDIEQAVALLGETRALADALATQFAELNRDAATARDHRAALEVSRAETTARLGYVRETCVNELNQTLEEVAREVKTAEDFDLEVARARVEELRARAESFGAVNMMALEELVEAEERFTFLTNQRQDIVDGISSTEEALREIKRRSRDRFREAFEVINRNFSELFLELFGGGRGEMSLIDADDILESGIDIIAQPPGKRLQNVLLLSGGEKAMAALSLVLAIFRYRPSPFCLLDEVDAPLDEANVGRFTKKILEMSASTQFLIITHNKSTMETARALYGVTMEDAGVSKLVSVKFE